MNEMINLRDTRYQWIPRWDIAWQIHPEWDFMRPGNMNDPEHPTVLQQKHGKPIFMQEAFEHIPDAVEFPLEQILKSHSEQAERFTATLPYILAWAAYEYINKKELERIDIYGFSAASNTEYGYQRESIMYWLGVLEGLYRLTGGPFVYIPEQSKLHTKHLKLYGYEGTTIIHPDDLKRRAETWGRVEQRYKNEFEELSKKLADDPELAADRSNAFERYWYAHACRAENEYWLESGVPVPRMHFELRNQFWAGKADEAKIFANTIMGQVPQLEQRLRATPKRHRGLREQLEEEIKEKNLKRDQLLHTMVYTGAVLEENARWMAQCDMKNDGLAIEHDTDIVPALKLRFEKMEE